MPASPSSLAPSTAAFRSFNRAYTRFLGTLNDHYLRTEYSLAEGRVLYELATRRPTPQAKEIAEALGLDPGYLSRMLRKLERAGLIARATASHDKRAADLTLTARGCAAIRTLNDRADQQAQAILGKLTDAQREQFEHALSTIAATISPLSPSAPQSLSPLVPQSLTSSRPGPCFPGPCSLF